MSHEDDYMLERGAVLASAVGVARLYLGQGKADKAKRVLDEACAKTKRMHVAACIADGHDPETVRLLFGERAAVVSAAGKETR